MSEEDLLRARLDLRETQLAFATGNSITGRCSLIERRYVDGEITVDEMETELEDALGLEGRIVDPSGSE
jgi:hypothetical protein